MSAFFEGLYHERPKRSAKIRILFLSVLKEMTLFIFRTDKESEDIMHFSLSKNVNIQIVEA